MTDTERDIKRHGESVCSGDAKCPYEDCPKCGGRPGAFERHEKKFRIFLIVVALLVRRVNSWLARWTCPLCGQSFTVYPYFAVPHKRYVKQEILERAAKYVRGDKTTYEDASSGAGYTKKATGETDERQMSPSTVWRWVGFVGAMAAVLRKALRLIREGDPSSPIFREVFAVSPGKYRSDEGKRGLERCLKLFAADAEYRRLFGATIFLHFEMGGLPG